MDFKQEMLTRIDALAAKLGVTADHIWQVLMKQAQVELWTTALAAVLCLGISAACVWGFRASWSRLVETNDEEGLLGVLVTGVGGGITLIMALTHAFSLPMLLMNPEYWALQQVLAAIK